MHKVEFCDIEEYYVGLPERINELSLCVGGIYTVMFNFKDKLPHSIRYNTRIENMLGDKFEQQQVSFVTLDLDLKPVGVIGKANIEDGIMNFNGIKRLKYDLVAEYSDGSEKTIEATLGEGFFKDYQERYGIDQVVGETVDLVTFPSTA